MMRTTFLGLAAAMLLTGQTGPTASQVMETASTAAAQQHKSIFLMFHASW
jgi:hypothetical protein